MRIERQVRLREEEEEEEEEEEIEASTPQTFREESLREEGANATR